MSGNTLGADPSEAFARDRGFGISFQDCDAFSGSNDWSTTAEGTQTMANALKFHAVVSGKTLRLPDLSAFEGKRVEVIVVEDEAPTAAQPRSMPKRRPLGLLRGQLAVPDDFDAPLPPEVQKYFDGEEGEQ